MKQLIRDIHRRSLWQVLVVYVVSGWVVLGAVGTLAESLNLPDWTPRFAFFILIVGLPIVLATAFVSETPVKGEHSASGPDAKHSAGQLDQQPRLELSYLTWRNALLGGFLAFSLLFGLAGLYVVTQDKGNELSLQQAIAGEAAAGIAFLPFAVSGPEWMNLREGMVHMLFTSLDGAAGLRAINDRTVLAQWDDLVGVDQRADLDRALEVAAATGATYAMIGSAVAAGGRLRLSGDIYVVSSGLSLGRVQVEATADSLFPGVQELAVEVLRVLSQAGVETVPRADLEGIVTSSLPALTEYLAGEALFRRGEFDESIPHFEAALIHDPSFALAHYRIAGARGWTENVGGSGSSQADLARALEGPLPPRKRILAEAAGFDSAEQVAVLEDFVSRHPDDAEAWFMLGEQFVHLPVHLRPANAREQAKAAFRRAAELDPGFAPYVTHLIDFAFAEDKADEARLWIDAYAQSTQEAADLEALRLSFRLLFERSEDSSVFKARIDSLARLDKLTNRLGSMWWPPRASDIGIALELARAEERGELGWPACMLWPLAGGRWHDFLAYAADPRLQRGGWRLICLFDAYSRGYPVPDELIEEAIELSPEGGICRECWVGAYAASKGRWEEYESAVDAVRAQPGMRPFMPVLEGFGHWKAGNLDMARQELEKAHDRWPPTRMWLGQIHLDMGHPQIASRYFVDAYFYPRSYYYRGVAHEQAGDLEKAQHAYLEFLDLWEHADSELDGMKQMARDALLRLGPSDLRRD